MNSKRVDRIKEIEQRIRSTLYDSSGAVKVEGQIRREDFDYLFDQITELLCYRPPGH